MTIGSRTTKIIYNYLWTRYFLEPTQLLPHPGLLTLAGLNFMSLNVMTSDNDSNLIPSVGVLEASEML